jgi:hypothetical protein
MKEIQMRSLPASIRPWLHQSRGLFKIPIRTGQVAAALGSVLMFGTALNAMAIVHNTYPSITTATLNPGSIDEGDTSTFTVTFADPDPEDRHRVYLDWDITGEQLRENFLLPPGQFSFQTTHKFLDGRRSANGIVYPVKVRVWVGDEQPGNDNYDGAGDDGAEREITVNNVAPVINNHTLNVTKAPGKSGAVAVEGQFTEPGADTVHVTANWADGAPGHPKSITPCTVNQHAKTFRCEHTYATSPAKTYQIALKAQDEDGGEHTVTHAVQIP